MTETRTGQCLCGAVTFTVTDPSHGLGVCHCGMCRRWSGGAMLTLAVPADAMSIEGSDHIRAFRSSDWAARHFCATCGSSLWYRLTTPEAPQAYYIAAGLLDDLTGMKLEHEIYIDRKPDAFAFAGPTHQMTEAQFLASLTMPASPEE